MLRSLQHRRWLGVLGGGANVTPINLLLDNFPTDETAPVATPRTCEPGPGGLVFVQNDGQMSVSSDRLVFPAQTTPGTDDQGFYGSTFRNRHTGRTVYFKFRVTSSGTNGCFWGWNSSQAVTSPQGLLTVSGQLRINANAAFTIKNLPNGVDHEAYIVILEPKGYAVFVDGVLAWVDYINLSSRVVECFANLTAAGNIDTLKTYDTSAPFTSDYGWATGYSAAPASGDNIQSTADAFIVANWTPASQLASKNRL